MKYYFDSVYKTYPENEKLNWKYLHNLYNSTLDYSSWKNRSLRFSKITDSVPLANKLVSNKLKDIVKDIDVEKHGQVYIDIIDKASKKCF